jgi:hypothetical protein
MVVERKKERTNKLNRSEFCGVDGKQKKDEERERENICVNNRQSETDSGRWLVDKVKRETEEQKRTYHIALCVCDNKNGFVCKFVD